MAPGLWIVVRTIGHFVGAQAALCPCIVRYRIGTIVRSQ